ncbi:hypothetical protein PIB30_072395 [Stylosanthes scabra]|uniref:PB1-like domain-containing protein n=1 Tax=Stylosanthes scabra TaxID=79078 RepID=A0ABU6XPR8_9FABA|nr:hypothetical protein [Stylosanthes scabra]
MGDSDFTIELHHGGRFCDLGNGSEYLGGMVLEEMHCNLDQWSLQEVVNELKQLGYKGCAKLWYCESGCQLSMGLKELMSDGDAMKMDRFLVTQDVKHCSVYVVDRVRVGNGIEINSTDEDYVPTAELSELGEGLVEVEVEGDSEASSEEDRFDDSADDGDHEDYCDFAVEDEPVGATSNAFGGTNGPLNGEANEGIAANEVVAANDKEEAAGEESEGGDISEGYETEDIDSYEGDSDDGIRRRRYPKYNDKEMNRDYEFHLGFEFNSIAQFREAIKEHAL